MKTPLLDGIKKAAKLGSSYSYSSTQVQLPQALAKAVTDYSAGIPEPNLYLGDDNGDKDAYNGFGREDDIHVTVKYGLHTSDVEKVRKVLEKEKPVEVTLGKISLFKSDDYEVVKIDVDSPGLHTLNKRISEDLKCTDTYPVYKPHVTIAYVKSGEGKAMEGECSLTGKSFIADEVVFSSKDGKRVAIKLRDETMKKTATPLLNGIRR